MDIKVYFFGVCISQVVYMGQCISRRSIARFRCSSCQTRPDDCCFGTLILPFVILTTSYCGDYCETVDLNGENVPIVNVFTHPHYKNFIQGRIPYLRNDISLVQIESNTRNKERPYIKLSAIDPFSAIGLKALVPVIDSLKPRLVVTFVQECAKYTVASKGFYICAVNKILPKSPKICQLQQGLPLLVYGKIIGMTGIADEEVCKLTQKVFIAIGPALTWIKSTVNHIVTLQHTRETTGKRPSTTITTITTRPYTSSTTSSSTISTITSPSTASTRSVTTTPPSATSTTTIKSKTRVHNLKNFESIYQAMMKESLITRMPTFITMPEWFKASRNPLEDDMRKLQVNYEREQNQKLRHQPKISTEITYPTTTSAITSSIYQTSEKSPLTKDTNPVMLATNAMEWFNKYVKNKLRAHPAPVLVLTTLAEKIITTPFIDLT